MNFNTSELIIKDAPEGNRAISGDLNNFEKVKEDSGFADAHQRQIISTFFNAKVKAMQKLKLSHLLLVHFRFPRRQQKPRHLGLEAK